MRQTNGARIEVDDSKARLDDCLITITAIESSSDLKSIVVEVVLLLQEKINDEDDTPTYPTLNDNDELVEVVGKVDCVRDALIQLVSRLREDVLRKQDIDQKSPIGAESLYPGSSVLSAPSMLPSVPTTALAYGQRTGSATGTGLGMHSSNSRYGYDSYSMPANDPHANEPKRITRNQLVAIAQAAEKNKMEQAPKPAAHEVIVISSDEEAEVKEKTRSKAAGRSVPNDLVMSIDATDKDNELAATEYIDVIYNFYKLSEGDCHVHDYMVSQPDINAKMRAILIDWLIEVHRKFELMPETFYLTLNIVDRFLSMKVVPRKELQLVGISSMLIASKYEEIWAPEVTDFVCISDNAYIRAWNDAPLDPEILRREECVLFAIAHANQFDSLLTFLDELSDFSRFKTLEINLQCCLLNHLADLVKVYSSSRLEKLFGDVVYHLSSLNSYKEYDTYKKCLLRLSCWKGLYECLNEVSVDTSSHISHAEICMEVLFTLLPVVKSAGSVMSGDTSSVEEWFEAVRCLGKAPQGWLLDFLKVSQEEFVQSSCKSFEVQKKVHAKIKIVKTGSLPLIELGKMKSYILSSTSQGVWDVLLEVAAVLYHAEIGFKRQWLIDALEISCVSSFPSTALQFIGLLSVTCCKYMPFINVDQRTVLNDLPVTLVSLLADKSWNVMAEIVVSHLFSSIERMYDWIMHIADNSYVEGSQ
ncbi:hypothetical protein KIW84_022798 [Lathyrus oleraceus]|uniref:B-like cyclin n=1 Tax=Pisum sativum TaxID=3888 RepID=A0A9D5BAE6_PEA|nr:hypothetical protein KIW84_022798 [Pisum sativum]